MQQQISQQDYDKEFNNRLRFYNQYPYVHYLIKQILDNNNINPVLSNVGNDLSSIFSDLSNIFSKQKNIII